MSLRRALFADEAISISFRSRDTCACVSQIANPAIPAGHRDTLAPHASAGVCDAVQVLLRSFRSLAMTSFALFAPLR